MTLRCNKHPLFSLFSSHMIEYPTPINLNYLWSFGSATGIYLVIQIITGIFLAMYYISNINYAFICYYFSLEDVKKNKKNESRLNGLKAIGPLTFNFKNKSFYFKHIKIPSFISLRNCKHISEFLGKFDIKAFSFFIKSQYSNNKAEILLNFIESLKEDEILNDFISFFSTKEILNFEQYYILEFCSPLLMRVLSQGLLIELRNHNEIRNDFFIKNIEKNLYFTEEEKKEFIFFLQKNINNVENIIEFWLL